MSAAGPAVVTSLRGGRSIPFRPHRKGLYPLFKPAPARHVAVPPTRCRNPIRSEPCERAFRAPRRPGPPFHSRASIGMPEQSDQTTSPGPGDQPLRCAGQQRRRLRRRRIRDSLRGYDRDEVDGVISKLTSQLQARTDEAAGLEERFRRAAQAAVQQNRRTVERLEADLTAANSKNRETAKRLADEQAARQAAEKLNGERDAATAGDRDEVERLAAELTAATARANARSRRSRCSPTSSSARTTGTGDSGNRHQFEEILRVAEEQASLSSATPACRATACSRPRAKRSATRRKEVQVEAEAILQQAQHDAQQVRLRVDTELTAHQARSSARPRTPPRRCRRPSRRPPPSAPRPRRAPPRCDRWSRARPPAPAPRPSRRCASCACAPSSSRSR